MAIALKTFSIIVAILCSLSIALFFTGYPESAPIEVFMAILWLVACPFFHRMGTLMERRE